METVSVSVLSDPQRTEDRRRSGNRVHPDAFACRAHAARCPLCRTEPPAPPAVRRVPGVPARKAIEWGWA